MSLNKANGELAEIWKTCSKESIGFLDAQKLRGTATIISDIKRTCKVLSLPEWMRTSKGFL